MAYEIALCQDEDKTFYRVTVLEAKKDDIIEYRTDLLDRFDKFVDAEKYALKLIKSFFRFEYKGV